MYKKYRALLLLTWQSWPLFEVTVQLLAVAKAPTVVKYGVDEVLRTFMGDMRKLENVCIVTFVHAEFVYY